MDNYFYINQNENTPKEWTNNYLGKIVKSTYQPETNKIYQYGIEYNTPQNNIQYFNNNTQKEFNAGRKNVMKNIYQETKYK
tara:strand:+ start:552 stop:794 length:243 start_codon:yes stop_codon:yes gene_type:complete